MSEPTKHRVPGCHGLFIDTSSLREGPSWTCPVCRAVVRDPEAEDADPIPQAGAKSNGEQRSPPNELWPVLALILGAILAGLLAGAAGAALYLGSQGLEPF